MVALVVLAVFNPKRPHGPRPGPAPAPERTFTIESNRFIKDGEPLRLISGRCVPTCFLRVCSGTAYMGIATLIFIKWIHHDAFLQHFSAPLPAC